MNIVLASESAVKLRACSAAFAHVAGAKITPVKTSSGVPEQPFNQETIQGAFNRIASARQQIPGADIYVAIENGIFEEAGKYIDRPVVVMAGAGADFFVAQGEGVAFPNDSVEEAKRRGLAHCTVGQVMQEQGYVSRHDDPHLDLTNKSRTEYLTETIKTAMLGYSRLKS